MKSTEELKELYHSELEPQLAGMEKTRKSIKRLWRWAIFGVLFFIVFKGSINNNVLQIVYIILLGLGILFLFAKGVIKYYSYRKEFKTEVVSKIIKLINPAYKYNADRHIDTKSFNDSKLFSKEAERTRGDDYVTGTIDKTIFEFSELVAEYKTVSTNDGKKETTWNNIFSGLFFHADFNKHIEGSTFVLPDVAEKLFGKVGQKFQKANPIGELVKLENPAFEKEFVVYSTGQQEARYILTPTMMEAMVNIQQKYKRKMKFAFVGERVYCAIAFKKGLFEPRIKKSGVNFEDVEEMYHLFGLIETIIQEMNLNTRIWTKA